MRAVADRAGRLTADPVATSCWIAALMIGLAFIAFLAAWAGASNTVEPDVQVAYLVSGGLGGLSLLVAGSAMLTIQLSRWLAARERLELEAVLDAARSALERELAAEGGAPAARPGG